MDRLTDEQLVERLQRGQADALDELYERYARKLYAFCYHITHSADAEDLVHDVFVRVIRSAHTFNPAKASFRTWVFRIARNRCIDAVRRTKVVRFVPIGRKNEDDRGEELALEDTLADPGANVERSAIQTSLMEAVRDCIDELDGDGKQAFLLYYLGGKVYREIGQVIGKSTSMARNRIQSARAQVRRCLERKGVYPAS